MGQYLPVVAIGVLAAAFAGISLVMSRLLAPRSPSAAKSAPYESGILPGREPPERFPVRFYLVAMIFIIFDVEIIFLFPWAVIYRNLGAFGLVAVVLFSAPIVISLIYEIAHGGLDWGPLPRVRRPAEMVSPERTARTAVRRVGLDGRSEPTPEREVVA
ncbi:MAG TPA: NADH-quinone oxidoreductase subunit A [Acidimicrobiales bacterium]|jgi:NADH-quinone oxidoreductase subunit A|nr:NADH-quinone oxidoreductase subunit A [Acidimicrobiales bacterium]